MSTVRLSLIARALVVADGRILLANANGHTNTFLPGGHVEPGESCLTTIKREMREELGIGCETGAYLGAIEHSWWDEPRHTSQHELNHYFVAHSRELRSGESPIATEPHLTFFWSTVEEFEQYNLLPIPLREMIARWVDGDQYIWWASTL